MLRTLGFAIACGLILTACPGGGSPGGSTTVGSGSGKPRGGGGHGGGGGSGSGSASQGDPALAAGMKCPDPGCVFHPGLVGGAYFACFSSGAGSCFHFGARCAPADHCMYDPGSKSYRTCADPVEGECGTYGAACTPASACAFNPADGLHHACESWSNGTCGRWGSTCAP